MFVRNPFPATIAILAGSIVSLGAVAKAEQVSHSVLNGQTLHLDSNSLQRVKMRAKTLTVGGCALTVQFGGEISNLFAPPVVWSEWTPIGPGMTGGSHSVSFRKECDDVPVVAEVQYWQDPEYAK